MCQMVFEALRGRVWVTAQVSGLQHLSEPALWGPFEFLASQAGSWPAISAGFGALDCARILCQSQLPLQDRVHSQHPNETRPSLCP